MVTSAALIVQPSSLSTDGAFVAFWHLHRWRQVLFFCPFCKYVRGRIPMLSKLKLSLRNINYRLYFALLILGLAPTVYTTLRVFFLGQLPGEWSFSIAGQLSWVNLLYEILN